MDFTAGENRSEGDFLTSIYLNTCRGIGLLCMIDWGCDAALCVTLPTINGYGWTDIVIDKYTDGLIYGCTVSGIDGLFDGIVVGWGEL